MKIIFVRVVVFLLIIVIGSCQREPEVDIAFALVKLSKMHYSKAIRVKVKNNSVKNIFILTAGSVSKVLPGNPCNNKLLGEYVKVSFQLENDCMWSPNMSLFKYFKMVPFDQKNLIGLKEKLSHMEDGETFVRSFCDTVDRFNAMSPMPFFTFMYAKKSTYVYFIINSDLLAVDKGSYRLEWYSKYELEQIVSPNHGKLSLKRAIKGQIINGYQYYDGKILVHPLQIEL